MRTAFFAINFTAATLVFCLAVVGVIVPFYGGDSGPALVGAFMLLIPSAYFAALEWALFHRRRITLERPLGLVCLALSAFVFFGIVVTVAESMTSSPPDSLTPPLAAAALIAGYLAACGLFRIRESPR
jgi:peptidoglycan/LPS O-acetylase OafA/YrhL